MKYVLKLESLGLLILFTALYFHLYPGEWGLYLALFFLPDLSFILFVITKKLGAIFLAHSTFDRVAGYGLKHFDSFDHTHLGWVGKSKHLNKD